MGFDLVIRDGTIIDGSGLASYRADVGIVGERVAHIGRIREHGAQEVDAGGHVVTPGFVDGHTHMDAQVMWDPYGSCSCWHGVTTVVMGNCGFTLAPVHRGSEDLVVGNLERAEDISPRALAAGVDWSWETFAEYLDAVDAQPKAINYAAQVGHSALRTWAMGSRAFEGEASEDDMRAMERELDDAIGAGAFGFTTSRSVNHERSDNRPVASRFAAWEEVERLVGAMAEAGGGIFELSQEPAAYSTDDNERTAYQRRLAQLTIDTGVPITFGVGATRQLPFLEAAAAAGGRMFGMSHSRGIAVMLSFRTRLPFDRLPEWKELRQEPLEAQRKLLMDPAVRQRLVQVASTATYGEAIGADPRAPDYDNMRVLLQPLPPNPTVAELAQARAMNPVDLIIELGLDSNFEQFFVQPLSGKDQDELLAVMKHPRTVMTFSDSGAHVSQIIDSSIQTHLLGHWVRDRQAFTLEQAIRMLTLSPASAWGIVDRGLLREGYFADINVIDPDRIAPTMPVVVEDLPAGERRLVQKADGIRTTVVNGQIAFRDGEAAGPLPGHLLRRRARAGG